MSADGRTRRRPFTARGTRWALPLAAALVVLATPAAGQDFGPDTCLVGYVWREASPSDHVCVTPETRELTRQDNAQAAARRSPNGGPFGPDTCLSGFVWREAFSGDHVCVTPVTRELARSDNLNAAARRNDLRTSVGTYGRPARYSVRTDRINVGTARVRLVLSASGRTLKLWTRSVPRHSSAPGGLLSLPTGVRQCRGAANAYITVQDPVSRRSSSRLFVCVRLPL